MVYQLKEKLLEITLLLTAVVFLPVPLTLIASRNASFEWIEFLLTYGTWIFDAMFGIYISIVLRQHRFPLGFTIGTLSMLQIQFGALFYLLTILTNNSMKTKQNLISKYALILAISYCLELLLNMALKRFFLEAINQHAMLKTYIIYSFNLLLSGIIAIIINIDARKLNTKTKYVTLATMLFRPVGVFSFLMYALLREEEKEINRPQ